MSILSDKTQSMDALVDNAKADFKSATKRYDELQVKIEEAKAETISLDEAMRVVDRWLDEDTKRAQKNITERLSVVSGPAFDPSKNFESCDFVTLFGSGSPLAESVVFILKDAIRETAKRHFEGIGLGKSKLTYAKKAENIAKLTAELDEAESIRQEAARVWRRLTGRVDGVPL